MTKSLTRSLFRASTPIQITSYRTAPVPTILVPVKTERAPQGIKVAYDGDVPLGTIYR